MTAAAALSVLWPLSRPGCTNGGNDVKVYSDQLDEIGRDHRAGLIGDVEAEAARIEVSRRLIAADDAASAEKARSKLSARLASSAPLWHRRTMAIAGLVLLPVGAVALYLQLGSPQLPGAPLAARMAEIHGKGSIASLISQVEAHLERNPDDARGYEVLAPVYMRLGRFDEAVNARRKLLALKGENAERQADLGEALTANANGIVTADAKKAFERAIALDPKEFKARFFIGMAAEQDGDHKNAAAIWRAMLAEASPDAPWAAMVRQALAGLEGAPSSPSAATAPGPSAQDIAAASGMNDKDRETMIRGMVARLADRLKQNGGDIAEWQRLLRAYMVLGERDKASAAAEDAKKAFAGDPDKLRRIEDTIKGIGL